MHLTVKNGETKNSIRTHEPPKEEQKKPYIAYVDTAIIHHRSPPHSSALPIRTSMILEWCTLPIAFIIVNRYVIEFPRIIPFDWRNKNVVGR